MFLTRLGIPKIWREDPDQPAGIYFFGWTRKNRTPCAVVWGDPIDLRGLPRSGRGYKQAADIVGKEIVRLWRAAGEAIAAGSPATLPDGSRRWGPFYDRRGHAEWLRSPPENARRAA